MALPGESITITVEPLIITVPEEFPAEKPSEQPIEAPPEKVPV